MVSVMPGMYELPALAPGLTATTGPVQLDVVGTGTATIHFADNPATFAPSLTAGPNVTFLFRDARPQARKEVVRSNA